MKATTRKIEDAAKQCAKLLALTLKRDGIRCGTEAEIAWSLCFEKLIRSVMEED